MQARATAPSRARDLRCPGPLGAGARPEPPSPAAGTSAPPARTRAVRTKESLSRAPALPRPRPSGGRGGDRPRAAPGPQAPRQPAPELPFIYLFWWRKAGVIYLGAENLSRKFVPINISVPGSGFKCRCEGEGPSSMRQERELRSQAKCSQ